MLRYPIVLLWLCGLALGAWHFDEDASHYVSVADNAALTLPDADFSIGGWIKLDDNTGAGYQYFVSWNYAGPANMLWDLGEVDSSSSDKLIVRVIDADSDTAQLDAVGFGSSTEWQHLLLVRSGTTWTLYVDGVSAQSNTYADVDGCDPADALEFGRRDDGNADRAFGGALAEWAKWDRALNAAERSALVAGFSPACFPTALTWYLSMVRPAQELLVPLALTDNGLTVVPHCRIYP